MKSSFNCTLKYLNENVDNNLFQLNASLFTDLNDNETMKTSLVCEIMDTLVSCFSGNLGLCFDEDLSAHCSTLIKWYFNERLQGKCNKTTTDVSNDGPEILRTTANQNYTKDLKKLFVFDMKNCSVDLLLESAKEEWPCFLVDVYPSMQKLMSYVIGLYEPYVDHQISTSQPGCKQLVDSLNTCFQKASCLSLQEIDLIKNSLATYYTVAMSYIIQISEKISNHSSLNIIRNKNVEKNVSNKSHSYPMSTEKFQEINNVVANFKVSCMKVNYDPSIVSLQSVKRLV